MRQIGPVRLGERIAIGGMAEVFRGSRGDEPVIVKVLLPQYARDDEIVALFEHEAMIGTRLRHPRIVPVLEHGASADGPFIVSPAVRGVSLAAVFDGGRLGIGAVLAVADDLLDALDFVHRATDADGRPLRIVHRDVSPDNVLVDTDGRCSLIDFGIAKSALRSGRTRTGVLRGKVAYLAPEQVNGSSVDARADLYATAVVLFELATGAPYLEAESEVALLRLAEEPPPKTPSDLGADPRLDGPLKRALARFPEQRPRDARSMLRSLQAVAEEEVLAGRAELAARVQALLPAERPAREGAASSVRPPPRYFRAPIAVIGISAVVSAWATVRDAAPSAPPHGGAREAEASAAPLREASGPPLASSPVVDAVPRQEAAPSEAAPANAGPSEPTPSASAGSARPRSISRVTSSAPASTSAPLVPASAASAASAAPVIDKAFVQGKIAEVNRRISAAKADGRDVGQAEAKSASALEAYLDGRYEQANRQLDAILTTLR